MSVRVFRLGGIEVPIHAGFELSQTYEPVGGYATLRMLNGAAVKQQQWEKIGTTIIGTGMFPPGLSSIDYCLPYVMQCVGYREVTSTGTTMEVTQSRRSDTDHEPVGFYQLSAIGEWRPTSISSVVASGTRPGYDDITLTAVADAIAYRIKYLPEITVFAEQPDINDDVREGEVSWTLNAEEV